MSDFAIKVEGVGKRYKLGSTGTIADLGRSLRDLVGRRDGDRDLWALRDVSFTVEPGEVIGVVGPNGAGKSTLLKILSRIARPTVGRVTLCGRTGSLLEVGTGFHPEFTGRENIYMNGAILGMRRAEIDRRFDEIVAFAEVSPFLDTPVKRYSSGMRVRLAFAVAAHLDPEILLIDEVLAVGDAAFQRKCLGRMNEVSKHGRTILFVSHNMQAIRNLCGRAMLFDHGTLSAAGPVDEIIDTYLTLGEEPADGVRELSLDMHVVQPPGLEVFRIEILRANGEPGANLRLNERFRIRVHYRIHEPANRYRLSFNFLASDTTRVATLNTIEGFDDFSGEPGVDYAVEVAVTNVFLPGTYRVDVLVTAPAFDHLELLAGPSFEVVPMAEDADTVVRKRKGFVWLDAQWDGPRVVAGRPPVMDEASGSPDAHDR